MAKPSSSPPQLVSAWAWGFFIFSIITMVVVFLATVWQPTLFPVHLVNPNELRPLPKFLDFDAESERLWIPLVATIAIAISLNFIPSNNVSRLIVRWFVFLLGARYILWRGMATLNFAHWFSAGFSSIFYGLEVLYFLIYGLYLIQTSWLTDVKRSREANYYQEAVLSGDYCPTVDVLIPTYNEAAYIVRRTIVGCQAMAYPNKTIYVLDDGRRPEIAKLSQKLGCKYITRPNNEHRKAGNLNHALKQTQGELIAIFDSDFVPFRNFLVRTVGFFQNPNISMVQTPQHFYNADYHSQNLGIDFMMPGDMEYFFGFIQPGRDAGNAIICCGTSYVVRRKDIEASGGYYTDCIVEDYQTGTRMQTNGYRLIYLNEILSMGESPRNFQDYLEQRLRWLQGNMQLYYCGKDIPIWSRLNWFQKSCHLSLLLYNFNSFIRVAFVFGPLISMVTGVSLTVAGIWEYAYYAVPYSFLNIATFSWATKGRFFSLWGEVYEVLFAFPAIKHLIAILKNPFAKLGSVVTRKGALMNHKSLNLAYTWPWVFFVAASIIGIFLRYGGYWLGIWPPGEYERTGLEVMLVWTSYNLLIALVAILAAIDQPVRRQSDRFPICTVCCLRIGRQTYWGYTQDLSETGTALTLTAGRYVGKQDQGKLWFLERNFKVQAAVVRSSSTDGQCHVFLRFLEVDDQASRELVQLLYGGLTWWNKPKAPSGLDAIWSMLARIFDFRSLFTLYR
ncbi:glycosyltransferase [Candidatus Synechococcus calcipolaris G9]|uniref:cellulose synthase (UDP-forming) n=1 Tax=Candidatus Synechococcus calcipolaris G9 TaxID=1497997 RepID=A0ABT6F048_9SYNE|nr:glycosyltransferase [Candidatus Synechococcus calcipolaris]MDG2991199.1 glycosyltransferase [Candidatus Synechococcus calcipolaris G9]